MSADNWAQCPRCRQQRHEEIKKAAAEVAATYGKLPIEEWDALRRKTEDLRQAEPEHTFREDYEICGAESGVIVVTYKGECQKCGLTHKFDHSEPISVRERGK